MKIQQTRDFAGFFADLNKSRIVLGRWVEVDKGDLFESAKNPAKSCET